MKHALIDRLVNEHKMILGLMDQIKQSTNRNEKKTNLKILLKVNELQHHYYEEKLLFSKASEKEKIREGGPFCVLYYDQHMSQPPIELIEKKIKRKIPIKDRQQEFYQKHSPVCIPIDEHRAGESLLFHIVENFESLSDPEIESLFFEYQTIQKQHFKKEEGCFFCMINNLLTEAELDAILALWPPLVVDDNVAIDVHSDEQS